jgi:sugar lactone lactonase YvrE
VGKEAARHPLRCHAGTQITRVSIGRCIVLVNHQFLAGTALALPEICGNVCFGGAKRNRLFMAASQSLYSVYTSTQGAAPG